MRPLRFLVVGAMGIGAQLALLQGLTAGAGLPYLVATALAVSGAIVHNFLWHCRWTWRDRPAHNRLGALVRFTLANGVVSLVGNVAIMSWLVGGLRLHPIVANLIAIATSGVLNYWLGDTFVFPFRPTTTLERSTRPAEPVTVSVRTSAPTTSG